MTKAVKKAPKKKKKAAKKTKAKAKGKRGRPTTFTQEIADKLCGHISLGLGVRAICAKRGMPAQTTVYRWLNDEKMDDFREQYARAREDQAEFYADQVMVISDNKSSDNGQIQRDRLRVDARKWYASKLKPKKFGDKLDLEHSIDANTAHILSQGRERANVRKRPKS